MIIRLTIALRIYGRTVGTRGQGGEGINSPYLNKGGGDYTHHITTPLLDFQTFLRPCNGQCNGEWKDEMQRYLNFRCWVLHYNGVKFFLMEHSYLYLSWIWNTFFFINCMQSPQIATTSKRLNCFCSFCIIYVKMWMLHQTLFSLLCSRLCTGSTHNREFPLPHWSGLIFGILDFGDCFNFKFSQHKIK